MPHFCLTTILLCIMQSIFLFGQEIPDLEGVYERVCHALHGKYASFLTRGVSWPRATAKAAYSALVVGGIVGVIAFAVSVPGPFEGQLNADMALLIAWLLSTVVFVVVTLMSPSAREKS